MLAVQPDHRDIITSAVRDMYTAVAVRPEATFHFPTGRRACEHVGYPAAVLDALPAAALESFAGVGYPFAADVIRRGDTVLDIGSGSGTDVIHAASLVGPHGRVVGLDLTAAMREKCLHNAMAHGLTNVEVIEGHAERIPLPDASVDVVTTNGVINLVPDKSRAIHEMHRVLRPGGRVQLADIVVTTPPSAACRAKPELWAECIVGAVGEEECVALFEAAGFERIELLSGLDYFAASASAHTRTTAAGFGAHTLVMRAWKRDGGLRGQES